MKHIYTVLSLLALFLMSLSFTWPSKLEKKIYTTLEKTYSRTNIELVKMELDFDTELRIPMKMNEHLFLVKSHKVDLGYIYVGQAPSLKNVFDYAIVFDMEFEIINTKVLIYREKHGRQIGMKRWLKQFFGLNQNDRPELGVQIDGISGATISVSSMTDAVREVLISIDYLLENNKL